MALYRGPRDVAQRRFVERLDKLDASVDKEKIFEAAYKKADEMIAVDQIDMNDPDFTELYRISLLQKHKKFVADREASFETTKGRREKTGVILEGFVHDMINSRNHGWFGKESEGIKTSKYDDYHNGIDEVVLVDTNNTNNVLGLGVDITSSAELEGKLSKIRHNIDADQLGEVFYFKSENFTGKLENVPQVIVGVEAQNLHELSKLWVSDDRAALGNHRVRDYIHMQIAMQLSAYRQYAEIVRAPKASKILQRSERMLEPIRSELGISNLQDTRFIDEDEMCRHLRTQLKRVFT